MRSAVRGRCCKSPRKTISRGLKRSGRATWSAPTYSVVHCGVVRELCPGVQQRCATSIQRPERRIAGACARRTGPSCLSRGRSPFSSPDLHTDVLDVCRDAADSVEYVFLTVEYD